MSNYLKHIKAELYLLAFYQIGGGLIGFLLSYWVVSDLSKKLPTYLYFEFLLFFILYIFSISTGIVLVKNPIVGLKYSIINQLIQVFYISLKHFRFQFSSGLSIYIGTDFLHFKYDVTFATWQIMYPINGNYMIEVNLVSILLIIVIQRYLYKYYRFKKIERLRQLG